MRKTLLFVLFCLVAACQVRSQDTITVKCSQDYYSPAGTVNAEFSILIDTTTISAATPCLVKNATPGTPNPAPQVITFTGSWGGSVAAHKITIKFLNDAWGGSAALDRNLYIQGVTFDGATIAGITLSGAVMVGTSVAMDNTGNLATWTTIPTTPPVKPNPPTVTTTSATITVGLACTTGAPPPAAHSVTLTWAASTTASVTGYNVYRSTTTGTGYAKIASTNVLTYTDGTVAGGTVYYYVVTAVDASGESTYSNQATAAIP